MLLEEVREIDFPGVRIITDKVHSCGILPRRKPVHAHRCSGRCATDSRGRLCHLQTEAQQCAEKVLVNYYMYGGVVGQVDDL
jgi:hypothetical protein